MCLLARMLCVSLLLLTYPILSLHAPPLGFRYFFILIVHNNIPWSPYAPMGGDTKPDAKMSQFSYITSSFQNFKKKIRSVDTREEMKHSLWSLNLIPCTRPPHQFVIPCRPPVQSVQQFFASYHFLRTSLPLPTRNQIMES